MSRLATRWEARQPHSVLTMAVTTALLLLPLVPTIIPVTVIVLVGR
jgi:hypothetical protein